jgi:hypothetical protein
VCLRTTSNLRNCNPYSEAGTGVYVRKGANKAKQYTKARTSTKATTKTLGVAKKPLLAKKFAPVLRKTKKV